MQISLSSRTRSTSSSISALLRQHAQANPSTFENLSSSLSDIPLSLRRSSGSETSFTVHSYPISNHVIGDQESVSFLGAIKTADLPYHKLEEISRPPTPDPYLCRLRHDNQICNHPQQDLRYHILPVDRINNYPQYFTITRNRELTRLTRIPTESKFEVTLKFIGSIASHFHIQLKSIIQLSLTLLLWLVYHSLALTNLHLTINGEL